MDNQNIGQQMPPVEPKVQTRPSLNKGLIIGLSAGIVILLAVVVYLLSFKPANGPEVANETETQSTEKTIGDQNPLEETESDMAGWKTYANNEWKFEVRYPSNFQLYNDSDTIKKLAFIPPCDPVGVGCLFLAPANYPDTNFEGAGVSVSPVENHSFSEAQCRTAYEGEKKLGDETINGISYAVFQGSGIATGHSEEYKAYRTYRKDGLCMEVVLRVTQSNISNAPSGTVKKFSSEAVWGQLEKVLSTFKFTASNDTVDWKTYRNEEYGFEMSLPDSFKGYTVIKGTNDYYGTDYFVFRIPSVGLSPQVKVDTLSILTISLKTWDSISKDPESVPPGTVLGKNSKFVFLAQLPQDGAGLPQSLKQRGEGSEMWRIFSSFKFTN